MEVTIYLKSGQSFSFDSTKITVERISDTGEIVGLTWENIPDDEKTIHRRLSYIRLDDVSAITAK